MYCSKCGAVVVGKYCSCCGTRTRNQLEELRRAERNALKTFKVGKQNYWLAEACWSASVSKYHPSRTRYCVGDVIPMVAFEELETVREHAEKLYCQLVNF